MRRALRWLFRSDQYSAFHIILLAAVILADLPPCTGMVLIVAGVLFADYAEGATEDKP